MLNTLAPYQLELDRLIVARNNLGTEDLYSKKKIWLLVELGELANEIRFFKYGSKKQNPRMALECSACNGTGAHKMADIECIVCWGTGKDRSVNPVLEEYVDCIHLILSIVLEHPLYQERNILEDLEPLHYNNMEDHFSKLFAEVSNHMYSNIEFVVRLVLGIGVLLEFSNEKVIEAYKAKHKVNMQRQKGGY